MLRNLFIVLVAGVVIALPFALRRETPTSGWQPDDPVVVVVSPHNEAIRREFGRAFAAWHEARYGRPAKVDWRAIGGTTEIMRYLASEYTASFRAWWTRRGDTWPDGGGELLLDHRFRADHLPAELLRDPAAVSRWELQRDMQAAFRGTDDVAAFGSGIDVLFGGGTYDHGKAQRQGITVPPWPADAPPSGLLATEGGVVLLPVEMGGERWRSDTFFGAALSTFGICYNHDRLRERGIDEPPRAWSDLTDARYIGQVGVADPTKSGSISKAFEMIIHEQCHRHVAGAGYTPEQVEAFEAAIAEARLPAGQMPEGVPPEYQAAVEAGWIAGLQLVRRIGANARYFTDAAGKVPIDVSTGDAVAGLAIDFYGRYQAETSRAPDGKARMSYVTPVGGSSVSADPISLLRGAANRETAVRFIRFVLEEDGQKLWNYRPGAPGGPAEFALRRLPVRRDFYPSENPAIQARYESHVPHTVDPLGDPDVNPYHLAQRFTYRPRWTAAHFNIHRDLIRTMCLDAGEELRAAWRAIVDNGGPEAQPRAMARLQSLPTRPEPLSWASALTVGRRFDRLDYMREWTVFFRDSYRAAEREARGGTP